MIQPPVTRFILRDLHLTLEEHVKALIETKADRLFRHEPRILRLRIDIEPANSGPTKLFAAKGLIEISGPDMRASVTADQPLKAADLLMDKLDRMLRKRSTERQVRRTQDDIRAFAHGT